MESRVAVLEEKVDSLEKRSDEHEKEDERLHRYMTHMMEDLQAKLSGLERTGARFEADLVHRNGSETDTKQSLREIYDRLRVVERLIYIAMGGVMAVGALATFFGMKILLLLK